MGNSHINSTSDDSDSDRKRERDPWDEDYHSDGSDSSKSSRKSPSLPPSPPPKKPKIELKYDDEEDIDYKESEISKTSYQSTEFELKSFSTEDSNDEATKSGEDVTSNIPEYRSISLDDGWYISEFSESDLFKEKGFVRSNVYRAGDCNELQFYFVMEKMEADDETHLGVYVRVLSNIQLENMFSCKIQLIDDRANRHKLIKPKTQAFPRKPGFRFIGSMCKESIMGDARSQDLYVNDDCLRLEFKFYVHYKIKQFNVDLGKLLENNKEKDITLVVKGEEFPANRAILMARSSTFAMLLNKKKKTTKLQIKDVDPDIMKQLLIFIYTGYVTKLFTYADKLSAAAEKYQLDDLKVMCQKVLE